MEIDKIYLKFDFIIQIFAFRGTIMVLGAFLDSFQKIADAATNTKGKRNIHIIQFIQWDLSTTFYCGQE